MPSSALQLPLAAPCLLYAVDSQSSLAPLGQVSLNSLCIPCASTRHLCGIINLIASLQRGHNPAPSTSSVLRCSSPMHPYHCATAHPLARYCATPSYAISPAPPTPPAFRYLRFITLVKCPTRRAVYTRCRQQYRFQCKPDAGGALLPICRHVSPPCDDLWRDSFASRAAVLALAIAAYLRARRASPVARVLTHQDCVKPTLRCSCRRTCLDPPSIAVFPMRSSAYSGSDAALFLPTSPLQEINDNFTRRRDAVLSKLQTPVCDDQAVTCARCVREFLCLLSTRAHAQRHAACRCRRRSKCHLSSSSITVLRHHPQREFFRETCVALMRCCTRASV